MMLSHFYLVDVLSVVCTELFVRSVAMFCYVFQGKLRGPAWAVGSYSASQSAEGIYHCIIFKTLRQTRRIALYIYSM